MSFDRDIFENENWNACKSHKHLVNKTEKLVPNEYDIRTAENMPTTVQFASQTSLEYIVPSEYDIWECIPAISSKSLIPKEIFQQNDDQTWTDEILPPSKEVVDHRESVGSLEDQLFSAKDKVLRDDFENVTGILNLRYSPTDDEIEVKTLQKVGITLDKNESDTLQDHVSTSESEILNCEDIIIGVEDDTQPITETTPCAQNSEEFRTKVKDENHCLEKNLEEIFEMLLSPLNNIVTTTDKVNNSFDIYNDISTEKDPILISENESEQIIPSTKFLQENIVSPKDFTQTFQDSVSQTQLSAVSSINILLENIDENQAAQYNILSLNEAEKNNCIYNDIDIFDTTNLNQTIILPEKLIKPLSTSIEYEPMNSQDINLSCKDDIKGFQEDTISDTQEYQPIKNCRECFNDITTENNIPSINKVALNSEKHVYSDDIAKLKSPVYSPDRLIPSIKPMPSSGILKRRSLVSVLKNKKTVTFSKEISTMRRKKEKLVNELIQVEKQLNLESIKNKSISAVLRRFRSVCEERFFVRDVFCHPLITLRIGELDKLVQETLCSYDSFLKRFDDEHIACPWSIFISRNVSDRCRNSSDIVDCISSRAITPNYHYEDLNDEEISKKMDTAYADLSASRQRYIDKCSLLNRLGSKWLADHIQYKFKFMRYFQLTHLVRETIRNMNGL